MDINLLKRNPVLTAAAEMDIICAPIKKLGITYFSFVRSFSDGTHIRLSNDPHWTAHYYAHDFYNMVLHQVPDKDCNVLWNSIDQYPMFSEAAEHFDLANGTVIVVKLDNITERYFFGSTRNNHDINHVYVFMTDLLYKFILYFKEKAQHLISKADKTRIILPNQINNGEIDFYSNELVNEFLDEIKIKNVNLNIRGHDFLISKREAQILSLFKCGYSDKEISNEIGIAVKTVESYRAELKNKLNLNSTRDLISKVSRQSLLDYKLYK